MTVWELEARRDRQYFRKVLEIARAGKALRAAMLESINDQADRMQMDARVAQAGRATTSRNERQIELAFIRSFDGSPIVADTGMVRIADNEARSPRTASAKSGRSADSGYRDRLDGEGQQWPRVCVRCGSGGCQSAAAFENHSGSGCHFRFTQPGGNPSAIRI